ncbi:NAD(P)-dependent alcohol dehydrogenase [Saccharospirillum salsuginis]|uniref:NADPH:quinone reductase n=1 Tax=Saccharospirillum salsuginis TaxID=418750 RepID=A0A918NB49_9GAMM|nr:NAD(P)-dependent alcohol dehydrogenase [Saccharospirillum salsuginis]GGX55414.1 NADPH:quinone reductase [Saccharospirillum salsuginis]
MKALVLRQYGLSGAQVEDVETPIPGENHILIKVRAASLNDWDLGIIEGKPLALRPMYGLFKPKIRTPGCDVAGTVLSVGAKVSRFKEGDAVYGDLHDCGFGSLAEYALAREQDLMPMPASLSFEQAAALPHAATLAWQAIHDDLERYAGGSLLINGAGGGVGPIALQLAKLKRMTVTGVDRASKLAALQEQGFDAVLDGEAEDFTRQGKAYDLILDVQTRKSPGDYLRALKPGGTYVTVGGALPKLLTIGLLGRFFGRAQSKQIRLLALKANVGLEALHAVFELGQVRPIIDGPYPLEAVQEALQRYRQSRQVGRVVIVMGQ